jgi:hypothetical protein
MDNIRQLEIFYRKMTKHLHEWLPEGIIQVDIELLQTLNLLNFPVKDLPDSPLARHFHVIETEEKITLINEEYVIWIVPGVQKGIPITYTFIALNRSHELKLELCFETAGVYNTSRLVLRILEKYLTDISENEALIEKMESMS